MSDFIMSEIVSKIYSRKASKHKGDAGVSLVIGGSLWYCGAPYFASMASLYTVIVLC